MGRILDAIRRKRTGPSTPTSLQDSLADFDSSSPLNLNSQDDDDKENASYKGNAAGSVGNNSSISGSRSIFSGNSGNSSSLSGSSGSSFVRHMNAKRKEALRLGNREVLVGDDVLSIEVTISDSTSVDDDERKKGSFETNDGDDSELVAAGSSGDSTLITNAISVGEFTEVSDDGILRDDEGNPIDPDEAEKNMLRDDEGNIIDPKSLVVRDFLLDLSCESDEYYDDSGEHVNPKELISCVGLGDGRAPIVTDSSTHSEGEADAEYECEFRTQPLHEDREYGPAPPAAQGSSRGSKNENSLSYSTREVESYENSEVKGRKSSASTRRRRRSRKSAFSAPSDNEYVHIMFNNRLTTLEEESLRSPQDTSDSGDEADDESPAPSPRNHIQPSSNVRGIGSFDEKFIRARWEYSLQMMNCAGSGAIGTVIDDVLVTSDTIGLDDEGEI